MKKLILLLFFIPAISFAQQFKEDTLDVTFKVYRYGLNYKIESKSTVKHFIIKDTFKLPVFNEVVTLDIPNLEKYLYSQDVYCNLYYGHFVIEYMEQPHWLGNKNKFELIYEITLHLNCKYLLN